MRLNEGIVRVIDRIAEGKSKLNTLIQVKVVEEEFTQEDENGKNLIDYTLKKREDVEKDFNLSENQKNQIIDELNQVIGYLKEKGVKNLEMEKSREYISKEFEKISELIGTGTIQPARINSLLNRIRDFNNHPLVSGSEKIDAKHMKNKNGETLMEVILRGKFIKGLSGMPFKYIQDVLNRNEDMFDFSFKNKAGETYLHIAAKRSELFEVLPLFIQQGVDKNIRNNEGKTFDMGFIPEQKQELDRLCKEFESEESVNSVFRYIDSHNIDAVKDYVNKNGTGVFRLKNKAGITFAEHAADMLDKKALEYMIEKDSGLVTEQFIDKSQIKAIPDGTTTLLHRVINSIIVNDAGKLELIELLIKNQADINATNVYGETPLYISIEKNMLDVAELLIKNKANVNLSSDVEGLMPIYKLAKTMCGLESTNFQMWDLLIENGAKVDKEELQKMLNDQNFKANRDYCTLFIQCLDNKLARVFMYPEGQRLEFIQNYTKKYPFVSVSKTMKDIAKGRGNINMEVLLEEIAKKRHDEIVKLVGESVEKPYDEIVRLLIEKGADIIKKDEHEYTALMWAVNKEEIELVELLIKKGADVNAEIEGVTPIYELAKTMCGLESTNFQMWDLLIENGAKVNKVELENLLGAMNFQVDYFELFIEALDNKLARFLLCSDLKVIPNYIEQYPLVRIPLTIVKIAREKGYMDIADLFEDTAIKRHDEIVKLVKESAEKSYDEIVELLIKKGANINEKDNHADAALVWAASLNEIELVKLLVKKGADINAKGQYGDTALMYAVKAGNKEVVELLIEKGANINEKDEFGVTALMSAAGAGNKEVVELLIKKGANINEKDEYGDTALVWAVNLNKFEIVELLIEEGADINVEINGEPILIWAAKNGKLGLLNLLIDKGADINEKDKFGNTSLIWAARSRRFQLAKLLIEKGADIKIYGTPILGFENYNRKFEAVRLLIEKDPYIKINGEPILVWTANKGELEIVEILIEKGADINVEINGEPILIWAARNGYTKVVEILIEKGADINVEINGEPILIWAARNGYTKVVEILIEKGADINVEINGRPILIWAAKNGHMKVVEILIEKGVDINEIDISGSTALIWAARAGNKEVVEILIEKGADINIENNNGKTALVWADIIGNKEVVKLLIEKWEDIDVKNNGELILKCAVSCRCRSVVESLIKKAADINVALLSRAAENMDINCEDLIISAVKDLLSKAGTLNITSDILNEATKNLERTNSVFAMWRSSTKLAILSSLQQSNRELRQEIARTESSFIDISKKIKSGISLEDEIPNWNITDAAGNTLLHVATKALNIEVVKFLMKKINPDKKNNRGWTSFDVIKNYQVSGKVSEEIQEKNTKLKQEITKILDKGKKNTNEIRKFE